MHSDQIERKFCRKCGSQKIIKIGFRKSTQRGTRRQRFKCKNCNFKFMGIKKYMVQEIKFVYKNKPIQPQNWIAYNEAQRQHKQGLMRILKEMLDLIEIKTNSGAGRPTHDLKEMCFALAMKTFTRLSARRLHGELEIAKQLGHINKVPHFTVLLKHLGSKQVNTILKELLKLSALPIKKMSSKNFSIDATGFTTNQFGRWFDHYKGVELNRREWLKCHAVIENKSNVIVNATITDGYASDSPRFERLVIETSKEFEVKAIMADKGYLSKKNLELVVKLGIKGFIPFKKGITGKSDGSLIWRKLYLYFKNNPQEFFRSYHERSNVETSFSMIKMKLDSTLKTKTFTGQENEILLKLLVHNCLCLIHEYYEKNIEKHFNTQTPKIQIPLN